MAADDLKRYERTGLVGLAVFMGVTVVFILIAILVDVST
jgi:hypothetical protein